MEAKQLKQGYWLLRVVFGAVLHVVGLIEILAGVLALSKFTRIGTGDRSVLGLADEAPSALARFAPLDAAAELSGRVDTGGTRTRARRHGYAALGRRARIAPAQNDGEPRRAELAHRHLVSDAHRP